MDNFRVIKALGQGTWGQVHMAEQKKTGRIVAIKKIKSERSEEGVNFTAIRELKLLREFKHPNIIELVDCFTTPDQAVCLVYECAFTDLEKILQNKSIPLGLADIKRHILSLLSAVSACHERFILHRDIKVRHTVENPASLWSTCFLIKTSLCLLITQSPTICCSSRTVP